MNKKNKIKKNMLNNFRGLDFETFRNKAFQDQEFVAEYEALRPEFELLSCTLQVSLKAKKGL